VRSELIFIFMKQQDFHDYGGNVRHSLKICAFLFKVIKNESPLWSGEGAFRCGNSILFMFYKSVRLCIK
jgi:hypothetical protein